MFFCSECGAKNENHSSFCDNCGTRLESIAQSSHSSDQVVQRVIELPTSGVSCSCCFVENPVEAKFCQECGVVLAPSDSIPAPMLNRINYTAEGTKPPKVVLPELEKEREFHEPTTRAPTAGMVAERAARRGTRKTYVWLLVWAFLILGAGIAVWKYSDKIVSLTKNLVSLSSPTATPTATPTGTSTQKNLAVSPAVMKKLVASATATIQACASQNIAAPVGCPFREIRSRASTFLWTLKGVPRIKVLSTTGNRITAEITFQMVDRISYGSREQIVRTVPQKVKAKAYFLTSDKSYRLVWQ